jgi:hypothetical protein
LAEKTVGQVRDLALLLRPSMLDDLGLTLALNWHACETSKRTELNVVVSPDEAIDSLPDEHRRCIYRLVQEAVNNAVRHANARTIEVAVRKEHEKVDVPCRMTARASTRASCAAWACWLCRGLRKPVPQSGLCGSLSRLVCDRVVAHARTILTLMLRKGLTNIVLCVSLL